MDVNGAMEPAVELQGEATPRIHQRKREGIAHVLPRELCWHGLGEPVDGAMVSHECMGRAAHSGEHTCWCGRSWDA